MAVNPTGEPSPAMVEVDVDWLPVILTIVIAVLGSSLITALLDRWLSRVHSQHDSAQAKADAVLAALETFRHTIQTYESLQRVKGEPIDEDRDLEISSGYNKLLICVASTADAPTMKVTKAYKATAERFAAADPETGQQAEETAFFALLDAVTTYVRKNK